MIKAYYIRADLCTQTLFKFKFSWLSKAFEADKTFKIRAFRN